MFLLRPVQSCSRPQVALESCFEGVEGFACLNDSWQGIPHFGGIGAEGIKSFVCAESGLNVICCTTYISDMLKPYEPPRTLRSSGTGLLIIHPIAGTKHGEAAFHHYAPKLWNNIPGYIRKSPTVAVFKSNLKTYLFNIAYPNYV